MVKRKSKTEDAPPSVGLPGLSHPSRPPKSSRTEPCHENKVLSRCDLRFWTTKICGELIQVGWGGDGSVEELVTYVEGRLAPFTERDTQLRTRRTLPIGAAARLAEGCDSGKRLGRSSG